jgi:hypothetical protein
MTMIILSNSHVLLPTSHSLPRKRTSLKSWLMMSFTRHTESIAGINLERLRKKRVAGMVREEGK